MGNPTYRALCEYFEIACASSGRQKLRNLTACLKNWLDYHGLEYEVGIGEELGLGFEESLSGFEYALLQKYKQKTVNSKKSYIKEIRRQYQHYLNTLGLPENFSEALRFLMNREGINCFALSKKTKLLNQKLSNWINGISQPNSQSIPCIQELETYFDLPAGALSRFITINRKERIKNKMQNKTTFGKKNAVMTQSRYRFVTLPPQVEEQWQAFVRYKTAPYLTSGLERKTSWRGDVNRGSATVYYEMLRSFFGYLTLQPGSDPYLSGKGLATSGLSFSMLTDSRLLLDYIEFRKIRSGGIYTHETLNFLNFCKSCLQENWGYFWQQEELGLDLLIRRETEYYGSIRSVARKQARKKAVESIVASALKDESRDYSNGSVFQDIWRLWCEYNKDQVLHVANELEHNGHIKAGRDVTEPIADILARQHPISALLEMAENMQRELPYKGNSVKYAVAFRNLLLVRLLTSNPLRRQHFAILTWNGRNTGNLYQAEKGSWRLRFKPSDFKNERGAASKDYDVPVLESLWPFIEEYLFECRKHLVGHD